MHRYVLRRLLHTPLSLLGLTLIIFLLVRLHGDPVDLYLPYQAGEDVRAQLRASLGLDQPLPVQYARSLLNMLHGDFGYSLWHKKPALEVVATYVPATVQLMGTALILAAVLGIIMGMLAAATKDSLLDTSLVTFAVFGQSMPSFWLGIMLIFFFAVRLHWLPASGRGSWQHFILPTFTLIMYLLPSTLLLVRSSILDLLQTDFVLVARGKGLTERRILLRHVLKNALNPTISSLGIQMGRLMGGAVVTETVFAWPGLGRLSVQAVLNRDLPVIQASVVLLALWVIFSNLVADLLNGMLDPRIRTR